MPKSVLTARAVGGGVDLRVVFEGLKFLMGGEQQGPGSDQRLPMLFPIRCASCVCPLGTVSRPRCELGRRWQPGRQSKWLQSHSPCRTCAWLPSTGDQRGPFFHLLDGPPAPPPSRTACLMTSLPPVLLYSRTPSLPHDLPPSNTAPCLNFLLPQAARAAGATRPARQTTGAWVQPHDPRQESCNILLACGCSFVSLLPPPAARTEYCQCLK